MNLASAIKTTEWGWYFGNLIFGGLVGIVVDDALADSLWTLSPKHVDVEPKQQAADIGTETGALLVMLRKDVPAALVPD